MSYTIYKLEIDGKAKYIDYTREPLTLSLNELLAESSNPAPGNKLQQKIHDILIQGQRQRIQIKELDKLFNRMDAQNTKQFYIQKYDTVKNGYN